MGHMVVVGRKWHLYKVRKTAPSMSNSMWGKAEELAPGPPKYPLKLEIQQSTDPSYSRGERCSNENEKGVGRPEWVRPG